jgi:hypothetical protein
MIAWQRDGIGAGQESITLIAYDSGGMDEAVGSLYEAAAGIDPLTPLALPRSGEIQPTTEVVKGRVFVPAWEANLPDRVEAITKEGDRWHVLSNDHSLTEVFAKGGRMVVTILTAADYDNKLAEMANKSDPASVATEQKRYGPSRMVKFVEPFGELMAVVFWGGTFEVIKSDGDVFLRHSFLQDISAVHAAGGELVFGLADGRLIAVAKE